MTPTLSIAAPMIQFDPSQDRFFRDDARVIVVIWHRQKGKDFTAAAKAVASAMETGQDWYIVSLTQRQADATFDKAKKVFKAYKAMLKIVGEATLGDGPEYLEYDKWIDHHFKMQSRILTLPNGAHVISLPGRDPDTLAGLTGNVIFTEFGLFPGGGYEHWRVVFPLSTRGFQVVVISTPRGKNTKFFELAHDTETYSVHFCDIIHSVAHDGFVLRDNKGNLCTIAQFQKLYGDPIGWEREYLCKFTGDMQALITWAQLIDAALKGNQMPFDYLRVNTDGGSEADYFRQRLATNPTPGRLAVGWDVARTGHLSSLWINRDLGDRTSSLRFLILMHGVSFEAQRRIVTAAMDARGFGSGVGAGDATGLGMESNEYLHNRYGDNWEAVNFGSKKSELGSTALAAFRDGTQLLPTMDGPHKFIHTDLYAIQRISGTSAGEASGVQLKEDKLKLSEGENPLLPESHCDIAYSGFLALRAAGKNWRAPLRKPSMRKPAGC